MIPYEEFLNELREFEDLTYRDFHKRLLNNENVNVIGVRVPVLRKLAKKYSECVDELMKFPDEYYEVTFIKLSAVSLLAYDRMLGYLEKCISLIDNWATCDCFCPKCIATHKDEFLQLPPTYAAVNKEFYQRFALTTLLHFYVEDKYFDYIVSTVLMTDTQNFYYVHMAAAWLVAELLIKNFDKTVEFLKKKKLDKKTHNKAIQKARESYRLTPAQKEYLKSLKI